MLSTRRRPFPGTVKFREVLLTALQSTVQPELGSVGGVEEDRGVWLYYTFTMVSVSADNTSPCLVSTSLSWRLAVHNTYGLDV